MKKNLSKFRINIAKGTIKSRLMVLSGVTIASVVAVGGISASILGNNANNLHLMNCITTIESIDKDNRELQTNYKYTQDTEYLTAMQENMTKLQQDSERTYYKLMGG